MNLSSSGIKSSGQAPGQNSTARAGGRAPGSLRYLAPSPESQLSEGQIIKGEVTDLRNNEVTVTLEDNTKITGQLEDSSHLSIGDTAAFKVISQNDGQVTLKALPKSEALLENTTIHKALEEAGLPKNEKNEQIVRELMKNQLPINKQSIQNILKESWSNKDVSISTLVLMIKHKIPITEQSALQFENYRNYEHRLSAGIASMADLFTELSEFLSSDDCPVPSLHSFSQLLTAIVTDENPSGLSPERNPPVLFSNPAYSEQLVDILESFQLSGRLRDEIRSGTASLRDVADAVSQGMTEAARLDAVPFIPEEAEASDSVPILEEYIDIPKAADLFDHPAVKSVLHDFKNLQLQCNELAAFLPEENRAALSERLRALPIGRPMLNEITEGSATAKEVIEAVKAALPQADGNVVRHLLHVRDFQKTLEEYIISNWTLTPKELVKESAVENLYERLYEQLTKLEKLPSSGQNIGFTDIAGQAGQMRQNIDFMKLINTMYTYVQLPLKLKKHPVHGELYVYTKRSQLREHPDQIRVLLHLDMDYLGPLDIHISLTGNHAAAKFYVTDDGIQSLLSGCMDRLSDSLMEKGFILTAQMQIRNKEIDFVEDFIEKGMPSASLKRYNFDIRA